MRREQSSLQRGEDNQAGAVCDGNEEELRAEISPRGEEGEERSSAMVGLLPAAASGGCLMSVDDELMNCRTGEAFRVNWLRKGE
ncbi:uncharacterized protein DS421_17g591920 [Arachis hypogaea]|nr:uncharacterized protein DS421_17g591920 [Arachis hypogaea]